MLNTNIKVLFIGENTDFLFIKNYYLNNRLNYDIKKFSNLNDILDVTYEVIICSDFDEAHISELKNIKNTLLILLIQENTDESFILDSFPNDNNFYIFKDSFNNYIDFLDYLINKEIHKVDNYKYLLYSNQKEMYEFKKKYDYLLQSTPIGIALSDINGNLLEVNDYLVKMLGSPSKELTKRINAATFENLVKIGFSDNFFKCIKTKNIIIEESPYTTRWGKQIFIRYHISPIISTNNQVIGVYFLIEDITERKKDEERLKDSLKEKEILLKEVHHRVKNNLQIVSSLLSLQSGNIPDKTYVESFRESQNRIRSMALIHEELYQTSNFYRINMENYINNLINYLYYSYKSPNDYIDFEVMAKDIYFDIETSIPIGLIINELISNSLKYAFENGSKNNKICIELLDNGSKFSLIVKDNGKGFPPYINLQNIKTLGLQLVTSLAEQLNGEFAILGKEKGTTCVIKFEKQ